MKKFKAKAQEYHSMKEYEERFYPESWREFRVRPSYFNYRQKCIWHNAGFKTTLSMPCN